MLYSLLSLDMATLDGHSSKLYIINLPYALL